MQSNNEGQERWAIILAGGEGRRLSSLTQRIAGDARPKQFCLVIGDSSLIEQTLGRVSMSVADERTLVVVLRAHEQYYKPLLGDMRRQNLVIQPENRGTATAILCSLLRLSKLDPCGIRSVVSLRSLCERRAPFHAPSRFGLRRRAAAAGTDSLVRRCRRKRRTAYGWIEPGQRVGTDQEGIFGIRYFWEKPPPELAQRLLDRSCLWNSFVMVARIVHSIGAFHSDRSGTFPLLCSHKFNSSYKLRGAIY